MTSRRGLNLISRWQGFTSGLFRAIVSWLKPIKAQKRIPNAGIIRISPLEKAMQDLHGDQWKARLSRQQRSLVRLKEFSRAKRQERSSGQIRPARDDEYHAEWYQQVEWWKTHLLKEQEACDTRGKAVPKPEQPESQA
ncbi:hypothetical protein INS49_003608 [Diaporthe citri]|uniref:uncharacterized protein n=1 Tax=Diaporthe citri TaxID=83186 RepID=UPI001C7FF3FE|nr:uncharacterized protein INS49_003608 [Diaporthe citri]KAG6355646.1 hypothetical protein INS49_003608 [Diaporthe citri]